MFTACGITCLLLGLAYGDVSEKIRLGLLPSAPRPSEYAGLELPAEEAAPTSRVHKDGLHHDPKDEDNLDRLCKDPFHSFLCKPVRTRRIRLDGKVRKGAVLPPGIVPEASNLKVISQPLDKNSGKDEDRSYLPPPNAEVVQKYTEPNYQPPFSNKQEEPTKVEINLPTTKKPFDTVNTFQASEVRNQFVKNPSTGPIRERKIPQEVEASSPKYKEVSKKYLPTDDTVVSPESTNLSPKIENVLPSIPATRGRENETENHSLERLCNDPFHSFLCKPIKPRRTRIDGRLRKGAVLPPGVLPAASNLEVISRPTEPSPDQAHNRSYLPPPNLKIVQKYVEAQYRPPDASHKVERPHRNRERVPLSDMPFESINIFQASEMRNRFTKEQKTQQNSTQRAETTTPKYINVTPRNISRNYFPLDEINKKVERPNESRYRIPSSVNPFNIVRASQGTEIRNRFLKEPVPGARNVKISLQNAVSSTAKYSHMPSKILSRKYLPVEQTNRKEETAKGNNHRIPSPEKPMDTINAPQASEIRNQFSKEPTVAIKNGKMPPQKLETSTVKYKPNVPSRRYLPVDETVVSPESTNLSPKVENPFLAGSATRNLENKSESQSLERLCSEAFHSFLCQPGKRRRRIDGRLRPGANIPANVQHGRSVVRDVRALPSESGPDAGVPLNYLPADTAKQAGTGYTYSKPMSGFSYTSTARPQTTQLFGGSTITNQRPTNTAPPTGYTYTRPSSGITYTTTQRPQTIKPSAMTTLISSMQTRPVISITTNRRPTTGYDYPNPTNILESFASSQSGYTYSRPLNGFTYPVTNRPQTNTSPGSTITSTYQTRPSVGVTTISRPTTGYEYPKPTNIQENAVSLPQTGYTYSRPSLGTTYPTSQRPQSSLITVKPSESSAIQTGLPVGTTTNQMPDTGNTNAPLTDQSGYMYSRPSISFTYPSTPRPQTVQTLGVNTRPSAMTTMTMIQTRPSVGITTNQNPTTGYQYPQPTNVQEIVAPSTQPGYTYTRPLVGFTYPSTQRPLTFATTAKPSITTTISTLQTRPSVSITTNKIPNSSGYEYPMPTNAQEIFRPPSQSGYTYPRPENGFTLPTSQRPQTGQTFLSTTKPGFTTNVPTRPIISMITTSRPTTGYQYPIPTTMQGSDVPPGQTGYTYTRPASSNTYTTTTRPQTFIPTTQPSAATSSSTQTSPFSSFTTTQRPSTGYEYPKPTNILENSVPPYQSGYNYPKPAASFTYPTPQRPQTSQTLAVSTKPIITTNIPSLETSPALSITTNVRPTFGYRYPKPTSIQETVSYPVESGYTYNRPEVGSTYSTTPRPQTSQTFAPTTRPSITTTISPITTRPSISITSPASVQGDSVPPSQPGYTYSRPPVPFTQQVTQTLFANTKPATTAQTIITTMVRPTFGYKIPQPTIIQESVVSQGGYSYTRPTVDFPFSSTERPQTIQTLGMSTNPGTTILSTRPTVAPTFGYQYPKPTNTQNIVVPNVMYDFGYSYKRPASDLTYAAMARPPVSYPTAYSSSSKVVSSTERTTPMSPPRGGQATSEEDGYNYEKPSIPFTYPPRRSTDANTYARPPNSFQYPKTNFKRGGGRSYEEAIGPVEVLKSSAIHEYHYGNQPEDFTSARRRSSPATFGYSFDWRNDISQRLKSV